VARLLTRLAILELRQLFGLALGGHGLFLIPGQLRYFVDGDPDDRGERLQNMGKVFHDPAVTHDEDDHNTQPDDDNGLDNGGKPLGVTILFRAKHTLRDRASC